MPLTVHSDFSRLNAKLAAIRNPGAERFMDALELAVRQDNREARLRGVDRHGRPLAPLKSERKGKYEGASGPPLAPFGERSRAISGFVTRRGKSGGRRYIEAGWFGVLSPRGYPFLAAHIEGRGRNPVRDIAGLTPAGWGRIRGLFRDWVAGITRRRS